MKKPILYRIAVIDCGNNILLDPERKMLIEKKPKGWFESSGCEIQRRVEKGFAGFVCFGFKKVKLYIIANICGEIRETEI